MGTPDAPTPDLRADRTVPAHRPEVSLENHRDRRDLPTPRGPQGHIDADVSERFTAHVGVRVTPGDGSLCGCGATATLTASPAWDDADRAGGAGPTTVPTGALLALVDATAREAAEAAVAVPGLRATLVPTATGVQFRNSARGALTASASVPCEGEIIDRADDQGVFRFSVAVDVVGSTGARVATGTVQWLARVDREVGVASADDTSAAHTSAADIGPAA